MQRKKEKRTERFEKCRRKEKRGSGKHMGGVAGRAADPFYQQKKHIAWGKKRGKGKTRGGQIDGLLRHVAGRENIPVVCNKGLGQKKNER